MCHVGRLSVALEGECPCEVLEDSLNSSLGSTKAPIGITGALVPQGLWDLGPYQASKGLTGALLQSET